MNIPITRVAIAVGGIAALGLAVAACSYESDDQKYALRPGDTLPLDRELTAAQVGAQLVKQHDTNSSYGNKDGSVDVVSEGARLVHMGTETSTRKGQRPKSEMTGFTQWSQGKPEFSERQDFEHELDGYAFWRAVDQAGDKNGMATASETGSYVTARWDETMSPQELESLKNEAPGMWSGSFRVRHSGSGADATDEDAIRNLAQSDRADQPFFTNADFTEWDNDSPAMRIADIGPVGEAPNHGIRSINPFLHEVDKEYGNSDGLISKREMLGYLNSLRTAYSPDYGHDLGDIPSNPAPYIAKDGSYFSSIPQDIVDGAFGGDLAGYLKESFPDTSPSGGWKPGDGKWSPPSLWPYGDPRED